MIEKQKNLELIIHIGMGKAGSSSIQSALSLSEGALGMRKMHYLGTVLPQLEGEHTSPAETIEITARLPDEAKVQVGHKLIAEMMAYNSDRGLNKFIFSNESLFENIDDLHPLFSTLIEEVNVKFIAYIRSPASWLRSAYIQWGLKHKTDIGRIPSYEEKAKKLLKFYSKAPSWQRHYKNHLSVIKYEKKLDVVDSFSRMIDAELVKPQFNQNPQIPDEDIVFRTMYNDRFNRQVLPSEYNRLGIKSDSADQPNLISVLERIGSEQSVSAILEAQRDVFEEIERIFEISITDDMQGLRIFEDGPALEKKLIGILVDHVLSLSESNIAMKEELARLAAIVDKISKNSVY